MLRGLLRWVCEGSQKGDWVFHPVGVSLRGNGSKTTYTPFSLPIPNILSQSSRMRNLLILPVLLLTLLVGNPASSADLQRGLTAAQSGDFATALREWKSLAKQGYADAQYNLGTMYYNGRGVIQDNVYAHMWFNIAATPGNKVAVKYRDIVAKRMTPADISAAQKLARECVRKKYKGC